MIFGLAAALGWGLADFFGAVSGRRIGSIGAVMSGQLLSAVFMTVVLVATGTTLAPLAPDMWLVVLNGAAAAFAYVTHYKALELGPVAVVSPIGAGYAVVGVALAILILGERPTGLALIGAGIAVVGVALVSTDLKKLREGIRNHLPGLPWAVAAAIGFGVAGFLLGWISDRAGWIAGLWGSRVAQIAFFVPLVIVFPAELSRLRPGFGLWVALLAGAADILGVVTFSAGSERGLNSIVLAASAVFPLIAVTLSVIVFKETLVANQLAGIVLVVGGLLLLGLG
ncbi:MAG TPA: EamA family transporter [Actinomycetota bacterium]|nr:EamA family transporter [Actinomycetota bacterium]